MPGQRRRATRIYLIPAVWSRVLDHGIKAYDVSSLAEADTAPGSDAGDEASADEVANR